MFGSEILEIAIGLALIYLLLSLVVTAITEAFSRLAVLRARNLYKGIQNLLGEVGPTSPETEKFFDAPMIRSLTQPGKIWMNRMKRRPGYISSQRFYEGLMQSIEVSNHAIKDLDDWVGDQPDTELKKNLRLFLDTADGDLETLQTSVEQWYDDTMDRVSGWFKRAAHTCTMVVAALVTVTFNASTINVAEVLWNDDASRKAVTAIAETVVEKAGDGINADQAIAKGKEAAQIISETSTLPLGWEGEKPAWSREKWISQLLGWLITTFALTLGAPFWFDALKNLVNLRTSGAKPK